MKTITAAISIVGCALVWTTCTAQSVDGTIRYVETPGVESKNGAAVVPGLFGNYPRSREATGTSWQPDSTQDEGLRRVDPGVFSNGTVEYGREQLSLSRNGTVLVTRTSFGTGTAGLQSTVSIDPFLTSAAYYTARSGLIGRDSLIGGGGIADGVRLLGLAASYSLPLDSFGSVFGYFGVPGEPALGPPVSYMRRFSGIDTPDPTRASHWLDSTGNGLRVFTVGYAWRRLKVEGSAFSGHEQDNQKQAEKDFPRLDSTSTRLSYNPGANWSFQLSRGTLSGLDQLEPNEDIRRTTVSATYNRALSHGNWQTTLAWGRNARKSREPVMGYLLESTLRFSGTHAMFGRLEQVGSDELVRENMSVPGQMFKLNRFTVGYFHNVNTPGPLKYDVGAFASRYLVPSSTTSPYANEPTSLMLFVRLKFQ